MIFFFVFRPCSLQNTCSICEDSLMIGICFSAKKAVIRALSALNSFVWQCAGGIDKITALIEYCRTHGSRKEAIIWVAFSGDQGDLNRRNPYVSNSPLQTIAIPTSRVFVLMPKIVIGSFVIDKEDIVGSSTISDFVVWYCKHNTKNET